MLDPGFDRCLRDVLEQLGLSLDPDAFARLASHYELLLRWNRRISLTSITDPCEIATRHFGESLFLALALPDRCTLVDVGSGAGFPGIPIAAVRPAIHVTLVESVGKKATFLKEATRRYSNVRVLQARIESVDTPFQWATARAVAVTPLLDRLAKVATDVGLLVGAKDANELTGDKSFHWDLPQQLPWGDHRYLLLGHSRHGVGST